LASLPGNETYNGDPGVPVHENFNFTSDNNKRWMTVEQLQDVIDLG
jgi:hypothetical protein